MCIRALASGSTLWHSAHASQAAAQLLHNTLELIETHINERTACVGNCSQDSGKPVH
ncbi:MAG: hypothetical protein ACN6QY_28545 [Pseudomonas sp.]|uniref:hypothetical protein n=1 Tax=Pseudomonas sp. TaxID=306 RepID=UPI003D0B94CD